MHNNHTCTIIPVDRYQCDITLYFVLNRFGDVYRESSSNELLVCYPW